MSANYEKISGERGKLESFLGKIPGYKGYKEKEMRREADSLVRNALVRDFSTQVNRLTPIQNTALSNGAIEVMNDLGGVKTALQTLVDRIRWAPEGYAGFFDAIRVKEEELDKLESFDQQLVAEITKVSTAIDALESAVQANAQIKAVCATTLKTVQEVSTLFDKRSSVLTGV